MLSIVGGGVLGYFEASSNKLSRICSEDYVSLEGNCIDKMHSTMDEVVFIDYNCFLTSGKIDGTLYIVYLGSHILVIASISL